MALASSDIEHYVQIALNVSDLAKQDFYLSYDAEADAIYINFHNPPQPADDSELTDDVIIRYDSREEVVGMTILHARKRAAIAAGDLYTGARTSHTSQEDTHPSGHSRVKPNS